MDERGTSGSDAGRGRVSLALGAAALLLLSFAAVFPSLRGDFLWDDAYWLVDSRLTPYPDGLVRAWTDGDRYDWLPLTSSAFWVEWRAFGAQAAGYRVVNVALHALAAFLVWRVLARLPVRGALAAAALFAVHPVAVASVAWITELKNTLSAVFFFGAMLAALRGTDAFGGGAGPGAAHAPEWRRDLRALALFAAALLAKGSTVVLAPILLVALAWKRGRFDRADARRLAPFFAMAALGALAAVFVQKSRAIGIADVRPEGFLSRLADAGRSIAFYVGKAVVPLRLSMIYPRVAADPAHPLVWIPLGATLVAFGGLAAAARRGIDAARTALALLAMATLALVPVLGLADLAWFRFSFVADHWAYLALPWLCALVVDLGDRAILAAARGIPALGRASPAVATGAAAILVAGFALLAQTRSRAFVDEGALWSDTIAENPEAWAAHNSYGMWLAGGGRRDEARAHFEEASRLRPAYSYPVYNLALTYAEEGDLERAKEYLRRALAIAPNYPDALASLGGILVTQGELGEGVARLEESLALEPRNVGALVNLGIARLAKGEAGPAREALERAIAIAPSSAEAHYHSARACVTLQDYAAAAEAMRAVIRLRPQDTEAPRILEAIERERAMQGGK